MWGGIKARKDYSQHFSRWVPTQGLEVIRKALAHEPRPWYLAFGLHQQNNLLQDHHCARLLSWCTTIVQLRNTSSSKKEAYRYAHETFNLLNHNHKPGKESFSEFMRLCAVGKDLTSAFEWHQHWIETKKPGHDSLLHLEWLLRIAALSPSDESAEDMVSAVVEAYHLHFGSLPGEEVGAEAPLPLLKPDANESRQEGDEGEGKRWGFFAALRALRPRVPAGRWRRLLDALPSSAGGADGWPGDSPHRVFPHLEGGKRAPGATLAAPRLRDSLLHPRLIERLETAAFAGDVAAVVGLLEALQRRVREEANAPASRGGRPNEAAVEVWRQFADPSARLFRAAVVQAGGLTPELYHYLVVALAKTRPSAALRTLARMRAAGLRVLDLTRAVALVAAEGAFAAQLALFQEQREAVAARAKLDEDFDIVKQVEHYWKYEYVDFFYYANALKLPAFYRLLMRRETGGPRWVQSLLLAAQVHGEDVAEADLAVLDVALRQSATAYFRAQTGSQAVHDALDVITHSMPKLDLSLLNSLPHFSDYILEAGDGIATDAVSLKANLFGREEVSRVYVLDSSFVETGEGFLRLGLTNEKQADDDAGGSLLLIPYITLVQLGTSIANTEEVVSFDPALQEAIQSEPFLASQRLRALGALLQHPTGDARRGGKERGGGTSSRRTRVLHFTECLQAHGILEDVQLMELGLDPSESDNDHLILVLAMLCTLAPSTTQIVLCTDDQAVVDTLKRVSPRLFAREVEILSTETPETIVDVDEALINDTPCIDFTLEDFDPRCGRAKVLDDAALSPLKSIPDVLASPAEERPEAVTDPKAALPHDESDLSTVKHEGVAGPDALHLWDSPWLSMLNDPLEDPVLAPTAEQEDVRAEGGSSEKASSAPALSEGFTATAHEGALEHGEQPPYEALMDLYASPNDVIPIGVKVREANDLGSIFGQFDVMDPDARVLQEEEAKARRSRLTAEGGAHQTGKRRRRRLELEKEALNSRGASNKEKYHLARQLSNQSGGRVPFNFRYRVVEANILDPRNAPLRKSYEEALQKKREAFKNRM